MGIHFNDFMDDLIKVKKASWNTQEAYKRDIQAFFSYLESEGITDETKVTNTEIVSYLFNMKSAGKSSSTINRRLASVRAFYKFLSIRGIIEKNPTLNIKPPKVERKDLEYLTIEEVERLLMSPANDTIGMRDKAIMELMYATGIRVNELIDANIEDVNLKIGFFTCSGESGKARIIPIGRPARHGVSTAVDMCTGHIKSQV